MTEIEAFIDYAIKERCEGCKDCDPKKNGSQEVVCMEQGFAHWIMDLGKRWQQGEKTSSECIFSDYPDMPYQFDNMTGSMNL